MLYLLFLLLVEANKEDNQFLKTTLNRWGSLDCQNEIERRK